MINEAVRTGLIRKSPMERLRPLPTDSKEKGILTDAEVHDLFDERQISVYWNGNLVHFTVNLLAASTGLRLGEIRGLRVGDIDDKIVSVNRSYGKFGAGPTKTKRLREVPIPRKTAYYLRQIAPADGYVFSVNGGLTPIHSNRIAEFFADALGRAGISNEERRKRQISFHSWRHFFNSLCRRSGVPDPLLRKWTGHRTEQMTELYSHFTAGDFGEIVKVQESLFPVAG